MRLLCAHCSEWPAVGILTVTGEKPKVVCRACGLELQKRAVELGLHATVDEMRPEHAP